MATGIPTIDNALARIARADKEAEASGLAFQLGPEAFAAHLKKTQEARLAELYKDLGIEK